MLKLKLNKKQNKNKGFAILDVIIAIAGVAILGALTVWVGGKMFSDTNSKKEIDNISYVIKSVRELYTSQAGYDSLTEQALIESNSIPSAAGTTAGKLLNAFKGSFSVAKGTSADGGAIDHFVITTNKIPTEACVEIATVFSKQVSQIKIGSVVVLDTMSDTPTDFSVPAATKECAKKKLNTLEIAVSS